MHEGRISHASSWAVVASLHSHINHSDPKPGSKPTIPKIVDGTSPPECVVNVVLTGLEDKPKKKKREAGENISENRKGRSDFFDLT